MKRIWIDTETTGTDPDKHDIWQLAGIIETDTEEQEFDFKMKPINMESVDKEALEVGGVTMEQLAGFPDARMVLTDFSMLLSRYVSPYNRQDKFTIYGFNVRFDEDMLRAWWRKCGNKFYGSYFWWPSVDVAQLAHVHLMDNEKRHVMPNFKLGTVATVMGIAIEDRLHDAMTDIRLTKAIFQKISG